MKKFLVFLLLSFPAVGYALDIGDRAPDFNATTLNGREVLYSSSLKGKRPVYLIFWATW